MTCTACTSSECESGSTRLLTCPSPALDPPYWSQDDKGANPNLKKTIPATGHCTPLLTYLVAKKLRRETECLLLCPKLNLEESDSYGRTAISYAFSTKSGFSPLAELLLQKKACIPDDIIKNIVHLAGLWNTATIHGKKRLLAKNHQFKRICLVIYKYGSCSPSRVEDSVLDLLRNIDFPK